MSEWQPIETAPRDGTPIIITDGKTFAVATPWDYIEPATVGWSGGIGDKQFAPSTERPNPEAGIVRHLWHCHGLTAWIDEIAVDYDHNIRWGDDEEYRLSDRATHWMPLLNPPTSAEQT